MLAITVLSTLACVQFSLHLCLKGSQLKDSQLSSMSVTLVHLQGVSLPCANKHETVLLQHPSTFPLLRTCSLTSL